MYWLIILAIIAVVAFLLDRRFGLANVWQEFVKAMSMTWPHRPSVEDYLPKAKPPMWKSETTVVVEKPAEPLTLEERINARYDFAQAKINAGLKLMTWKNFAGKRMTAPLDSDDPQAWRKACTLIEDSLHDVKTVRKAKSNG